MPFFWNYKRCHLQQEHFVSMRKPDGPKTDHFSNAKVFGVKGFAFEWIFVLIFSSVIQVSSMHHQRMLVSWSIGSIVDSAVGY